MGGAAGPVVMGSYVYAKSELVVVVLLIVCRYCSAQCHPTPPNNLTVSAILNSPVFFYEENFRPKIGGQGTDWWAVFSASQVRQYGLWCQVLPADNMGMGDNIGDWYYPPGDTPDGFTLLPNSTNDTVPYQSLKCTNQIGLVVDGDVTNNQGFVRCTTTIAGLDRQSNHIVVYSDSVFGNYNGPILDKDMKFTLLSSRATTSNLNFTLSFTVSHGPPSKLRCYQNKGQIFTEYSSRQNPSALSREVIRPHYINSSYPDMTRVTLTLTSLREAGTYNCTVTVEGRVNIDNSNYNYAPMGSGNSATNITVAGTPTNVTANQNGFDSANVSWTAPSTGTPPAGYEVFYQLTGGCIVSEGNTSNTELTLTGLAPGSYPIFVVGFGAEGDPVLPSARSETTIVTIDQVISQMPSTLTLKPNSSSIIVSWSPTLFIPVIYQIHCSCQLMCSSLVTPQTTMVDGATTTCVLIITPGSNCTVSVTAVFSTSSSSNTVTSSTNTSSAAPTGAPGGLTSTSVESRSLSAVWGTVPCLQQRGPITGYRLRFSNGTFVVNATAGEGSRQYNWTGLTPYTNYSVQVAAVNDGGTGPYSTPLTVETLQDVPGPVSGLSADPGVVHVNISWEPPTEPNGVIVNYEVGFTIGTGVLNYINTVDTHYTLTNVSPSTEVTFTVRAYTSIGPGNSVFSGVLTPDIPSISVVSAVHINTTSVRVTWTPVNLPVVDHYTVHYSSIVNGGSGRRRRQTDSGSVAFPASVSSGVVSGLLEGQQYQFSVSVTLSVGGHTYTGVPGTPVNAVTEPMDYISSTITSLAVLELGQTIDSTETALLTSSPPLTISSVSSASHTTQTDVLAYLSSSTTMGCSTEPSVYIVSEPSSSTLAYTAGVGVVSALLLLSLMGNVVYTIAMCALLRKKMKYHYEFKKSPTPSDGVYYNQPALPIKDGNIELKRNASYGASNPAALAMEDNDYQYVVHVREDKL